MKEEKIKEYLSVAKDFSETPGPRFVKNHKNSGQIFYEEYLKPRFQKIWNNENAILVLDLDGTYGYLSSFISEIYVGLIRDFKDREKILSKLEVISKEEPFLADKIKNNILTKKIDDAEGC